MSNKNDTVFLFPGQGSQQVGMGAKLAELHPTAKRLFEFADDILGYELSRLVWEGPEEKLNDTINTQPALYLHSMAALQVLREEYPGFQPAFMAGHSLGEMTALVAAGGMSFEAGLRLVHWRGELMKKAGEISPGGMAALIGLDIAYVEELCQEASQGDDIVQLANDNCPGQVVVSGRKGAVERISVLAQKAGATRVIPLAVSIAAHSPLMIPIKEEFSQAVLLTDIIQPEIPVVSNVFGKPMNSVEEIRQELQQLLTSRVRWTDSILYLLSVGVVNFVEIGSGTVLNGLVKRIDRGTKRYQLSEPEDFELMRELY